MAVLLTCPEIPAGTHQNGVARCGKSRLSHCAARLASWNCRDVQFSIGELSFDQLAPDRLKALGAVPTRFKLPEDQVDAVIAAGRDALRANDVYRRFLASLVSTASCAPRDTK